MPRFRRRSLSFLAPLFAAALLAAAQPAAPPPTPAEEALRVELAKTQAALVTLQSQTSNVRLAQNENAGIAQEAAANARWSSLATLFTSLFGFLTLIAGFAWKAYTDQRDHRWLKESHREAMDAAQAAYSEANDVNQKIARAGLVLGPPPSRKI